MKQLLIIINLFFIFGTAFSQKVNYKSYDIHLGDTINRIDKNGLKQGRWIFYGRDKRGWTHRLFNSKQIVEDGFYVDGKKNKVWKTYHHTNKLKSEVNYIDDKPIGKARFFNTDGKIMMEGELADKNFVGEYYVYDSQGNKIKRIADSDPKNGYIDFTGKVQKTLGKTLEGVKVSVERNDFEIYETSTTSEGIFKLKLELNFEYTLRFSKQGFNNQSLLINAYTENIYDTLVYKVSDWKVVLSDNIATGATSDLFGFLLNKPSGKIYYNKRRKNFDADGSYLNLFKKEFKGISETTKLLLAKAAEDNKKLEIENLRIEAEKKEKEIELLTKAQQLKEAELKSREAEIIVQKAEAEKKKAEAENEAELRAKEKVIKDLEIKQQQEKIVMQEMQAMQKAKEFEHLAMARKLQELELRQKEQQLNSTTSALDEQTKESQAKSKELEMANREKLIKDKELKQNLIFLYITIGVLCLVAVFSFYLVRNIQQKKRANVLLAKQAAEIEEKSKIIELKKEETEQSIQYAKRIQYAILPPDSEIKEHIKNYFVLYIPKDIVSGDFYFFTDQYVDKKTNTGNVIIAAVDCTGHGVPGAFMSMVGNEKLKDACDVSEKPSEILFELNNGIKSALRQGGEMGTRDGMDLGLVTMPNLNSYKDKVNVSFAGANRPLWLIRNNAKEVEEYKSTKQAIGGHTPQNQDFIQHDLELSKGDTLYLTSDGYADQFGGVTKKKLMTKKFKEILVSIQNKNMQEQHNYLRDFIIDWCADTEQIDDILVIGIRV